MYTRSTNTSPAEEEFSALYLASRRQEQRLYTDEEVLRLPSINSRHIHYREWSVRKRTAERLIRYLENKNSPLSILDTGSGNGWLSARLSAIKNSTVTGLDINETELTQAQRIFGHLPNLSFKNRNNEGEKFEVIIFAASIQYFPSLEKIIKENLSLLSAKGEIHILDSPFYEAGEIQAAIGRSRAYYSSTGNEKLAGFYYHHSYETLKKFNCRLLFNPAHLRNKLFNNRDPFPWVCISHT